MTIDIKHFERVLMELKTETENALSSAKSSTKPVELDQTMVGRLSRMDAIQQQEMALASERRRHDLLIKIDAALKRIAKGDYGYCIKCDEKIAEKRLELDPTILTCIRCASGSN
jgi:DnaK suppressor protein